MCTKRIEAAKTAKHVVLFLSECVGEMFDLGNRFLQEKRDLEIDCIIQD